MRSVLAASLSLGMTLAAPGLAAQGKEAHAIQWSAHECSKPLLLPPGYGVSKYGAGKYRIDGPRSYGRLDAIHILFQPTGALDPAKVPTAREAPFGGKRLRGTWRTYSTTVEGRAITRREVLIPNSLPRVKQGGASDFIWMRIDATSQAVLEDLTPIAEAILEDAT